MSLLVVGLEITLAGINLKEAAFLLSITIGPSMLRAAQISTKTPWLAQFCSDWKTSENEVALFLNFKRGLFSNIF